MQVIKANSLQIPKNYKLERDGVTQSLLASFLCCRQRCLYNLNLYSRPSKSSVIFGTIFHEMLDKLHSFNKTTGKVPVKAQIYNWLKIFRKESLPKIDEKKAREVFEVSLLIINRMLPLYIDFNKNDFSRYKWLEVEYTFKVKLSNALLRGKRDAMFYDKNKKLWLMEHKTKSRIDEEKLLLSLSFNFQNLIYIVAFEEENKIPVKGVLYNIIRNPQLKIGKKETIEEYINRVIKAVEKDPKHYFMRYEVVYLKEEKRQFRTELNYILKQYKNWIIGKEETFRNSFNCETPYTCEFLNACGSNSMLGYTKKEKLFEEL